MHKIQSKSQLIPLNYERSLRLQRGLNKKRGPTQMSGPELNRDKVAALAGRRRLILTYGALDDLEGVGPLALLTTVSKTQPDAVDGRLLPYLALNQPRPALELSLV